MAIQSNKQCHSYGLFWDCKQCNGEYFPPCYETMEEKFNSLQQLKAEISGVLDSMDIHISEVTPHIMRFYINKLRQKLSAV